MFSDDDEVVRETGAVEDDLVVIFCHVRDEFGCCLLHLLVVVFQLVYDGLESLGDQISDAIFIQLTLNQDVEGE